MSGKFLAIIILLAAVVTGGSVYYLQEFHYYERLEPLDTIRLATPDGGQSSVLVANFEGIDASSSPIRYRACFDIAEPPEALAARFAPYPDAEPRNAPFWFSCFDAEAIGTAIAEGTARVFTSQRNLEFGIDRVVAVTDGGRGYIWHEINECGDKAYDGTPLGDDCPPREGN